MADVPRTRSAVLIDSNVSSPQSPTGPMVMCTAQRLRRCFAS